MKYLRISNAGVIDMQLVALMGGTTKDKDKFKIGQFGTGLKYAMAYLYRSNIDFKIFAGNEEVRLSIQVQPIRNENFEIICIDGHRTGITTKMGMDWKAWMIIRELWCNALDEGEEHREVVDCVPFAEDGRTNFYVQITPEIQDVLDNWNMYFIHGISPLFENEFCAIYPGNKDGMRVYKNGVLIDKMKTVSLFNYDIKNAEINELREYKGYRAWDVSHALKNCNEKVATIYIENITDKYYEGNDMSFTSWEDFNENWRNVIGSARLIHPKAVETFKDRGIDVDVDRLIVVPQQVYQALTAQFEGIGALTVASKINEFYEVVSDDAERAIKKAITILETAHYRMHPDLNIRYGYFEDKNIVAQVNRTTKIVYINNDIARRSLFESVVTLVEENEHYVSGLNDATRSFQQHLINLYTRELLKAADIEL